MRGVETFGLDAFDDDDVLARLHMDASLCTRHLRHATRALVRITAALSDNADVDGPADELRSAGGALPAAPDVALAHASNAATSSDAAPSRRPQSLWTSDRR